MTIHNSGLSCPSSCPYAYGWEVAMKWLITAIVSTPIAFAVAGCTSERVYQLEVIRVKLARYFDIRTDQCS